MSGHDNCLGVSEEEYKEQIIFRRHVFDGEMDVQFEDL